MKRYIRSSTDYPIRGKYTTKRGTTYNFTIYSDNAVECYRIFTKPTGAPKEYHTSDRFVVPPQELKRYLTEQYDDNLRFN